MLLVTSQMQCHHCVCLSWTGTKEASVCHRWARTLFQCFVHPTPLIHIIQSINNTFKYHFQANSLFYNRIFTLKLLSSLWSFTLKLLSLLWSYHLWSFTSYYLWNFTNYFCTSFEATGFKALLWNYYTYFEATILKATIFTL